MQASKILEMLNKGRIEELKALLQDEIYGESLKKKPDARKRYTAMKKYFGYVNQAREILQKPCEVTFEGKNYISFTNAYSLALTTESCGEIELFEDKDRYPEVGRIVDLDGEKNEIDVNKILSEAKSKGYKLKKSEVGIGAKYLMYYDGSYYKVGLLDASYGIIADGKPATVYHKPGERTRLVIENELGYCVLMPMNIEDVEEFTIIEVK